jgi:hypothetical protein
MQFQASPCAQDFPGLTAIALLVLKELFCQFGNHNFTEKFGGQFGKA